VSGENGKSNVILCGGAGRLRGVELCFERSYRNCECEMFNVTASRGRLCVEWFGSGQRETVSGVVWEWATGDCEWSCLGVGNGRL
jgi:hypothetical protein